MNGGPNAPTTADYARGAADEARRRVDRLERVVVRMLLLLRDESINDGFGTVAFQQTLEGCLQELQKR